MEGPPRALLEQGLDFASHARFIELLDHATRERLHGRAATRKHVRSFQDKINIPRHEIVHLVMHRSGDLAVLAPVI